MRLVAYLFALITCILAAWSASAERDRGDQRLGAVILNLAVAAAIIYIYITPR